MADRMRPAVSDTGPVLIVAGPTASGKSALAVDVAERFRGVVINADSMQVYRGLDILTSAPDPAMRARAPHLLYGILDPEEPCSAGRWRDLAVAGIRQAHDAGMLPIVVGGTGLYLRALTRGIAPVPPVPQAVRERVRARLAGTGSQMLHEELTRRDPAAAARIPPGDGQRIVRALEVLEATGRSLTEWQQGAAPENGGGFRFVTCLLLPPREVLYRACDERFAGMLGRGALDEVRALLGRRLDSDLPSVKALGVPDLMRHLNGEIPLDEAGRQARQATRRYVKRQMTWFRHQIVADLTLRTQYSEHHKDTIFAFITSSGLTSQR
jgi:tRNA dimethylallyltransferase